MSGHDTNELGQPIGLPVSGEFPRPTPPYTPMEGQYCSVVPLDVNRHAPGLYRAFANDTDGHNWTYLPYGPFDAEQDFVEWTRATCMDADPMFHTVLDEDETPIGKRRLAWLHFCGSNLRQV